MTKSNRFSVQAITLLLLLAACGCFRQDTRTLLVNTPGMKTQECSKIIQGALSRIDGIESVDPDLEKHTLTIRYNSTKLGIRNIEYLIAGLGFDANDAEGKPEAKAALPADCR